jgi:hypothetical protein
LKVKSNDFIRSDFVKPNYDKSDCSASVFNSYNNNNNKPKDNSLLIKINKKKVSVEDNNSNNDNIIKDNILLNQQNEISINDNNIIKKKPETIVIPDYESNNIIKSIVIPDNVKDIIPLVKNTNLLNNKEDDIFNNSGKKHREDFNKTRLDLDINNRSRRKIDSSDKNNNQ